MEEKGRLVMMGDKIYSGIDENDICEVPLAIVIEFEDQESLVKAIRTGKAEFTVFEK